MKKLGIMGVMIAMLLTNVQATPFNGVKKCRLKVKHGVVRHSGFCPRWVIDNATQNINYDILK